MVDSQMLDAWIDSVCRTAGWTVPFRGSNGVYRFRLADRGNVDVSAPDGRDLIMAATIVKLPETGAEAILETVARAVLPRVFKDTSTIGLDRDTRALILQKRIVLGSVRRSEMPDVMERFLNDLHFYQSICSSYSAG